MKFSLVLLIAALSLVVGASGASWYWLNFNAQLNNQGFVLRTQAAIVTKVAVLEHLRAGRIPDATTLLESLLDGDLVSASALARGGTTFSANANRALALEATARASSGYRPVDDKVHHSVQEAFRLVPGSLETLSVQPFAPQNQSRQGAPSQ